ncbi:MAG: hypothetical protein F2744_09565 [Actinobacteria bacterium]|uniref:Unannotated protein n=1 Tax=freshwater metagenome TaxID=449393 RepID=A0A6J6ZQC5_9ZZZZ|nr:hypothetical protein [Actinomycetota bacterium]
MNLSLHSINRGLVATAAVLCLGALSIGPLAAVASAEPFTDPDPVINMNQAPEADPVINMSQAPTFSSRTLARIPLPQVADPSSIPTPAAVPNPAPADPSSAPTPAAVPDPTHADPSSIPTPAALKGQTDPNPLAGPTTTVPETVPTTVPCGPVVGAEFPPCPTTTTTSVPQSTTTVPPQVKDDTAEKSGVLAFTGSNSTLLVVGIAVLLLGAVALVAATLVRKPRTA